LTSSTITALFDDLRDRKVNLVSLKDGIDLSMAAGKMLAGVLASVAAFETEVGPSAYWRGKLSPRPTGGNGADRRKGGASR
jgi:hypothetical protein